ncbi:MAG: type 1 glutamine amidotransferase domain-containing protein [Alphaproteobacteria bacterium]
MAKRILFITTSHAKMGETDTATGLWLEELAAPWMTLAQNGHELTLSSVSGGQVPMDPKSLDDDGELVASFREQHGELLEVTPAFTDFEASEFDALFIPGGHGTMWDMPDNADLAAMIRSFVEAGKPVVTVCHGPAALAGVTLGNGESVVKDRRITCFTDSEEAAMELTEVVPFLLASRLQTEGATLDHADDFQPKVVTDGPLITGQNPPSSTPAAEALIDWFAQNPV